MVKFEVKETRMTAIGQLRPNTPYEMDEQNPKVLEMLEGLEVEGVLVVLEDAPVKKSAKDK